jgi:methionyl-tRNA synthetase
MAAQGGVRLTDIAPVVLTNEFGVDPVRYFLLRDTALGNDGDFSLEGITLRYNTDLANNLGNLLARVSSVVHSKCSGIGPLPQADSVLRAPAEVAVAETMAAWNSFAPQSALEATWGLISATNAYLEQRAPWKMDPGSEVDAVMGDALEAIRLVAILASPAMPQVCEEIWRRIGLSGRPSDELFSQSTVWAHSPAHRTVEKGEPLFPRIKSDE